VVVKDVDAGEIGDYRVGVWETQCRMGRGEGDDPSPGGVGRCDSGWRIFEHDTGGGIVTEALRAELISIRSRLSP
jgi:hypothetical protein